MRLVAALAAGALLFASGFLAACAGNGATDAPDPSTSGGGTSVTIILSGPLTLIESKSTP